MGIERPSKRDFEDLLESKTRPDAARYYGVSLGTINRWLIFYGIQQHKGNRPTREQIEECVEGGMEAKEIAAKYGISASTLSTLMSAFGIKCSKIRAQEARKAKVLKALETPMTLGDLAKATGIKANSLSAYMARIKLDGEADLVGEHEDGRALWGIPKGPIKKAAKLSPDDFLAPVSGAPQHIGMIEHQLQAGLG